MPSQHLGEGAGAGEETPSGQDSYSGHLNFVALGRQLYTAASSYHMTQNALSISQSPTELDDCIDSGEQHS